MSDFNCDNCIHREICPGYQVTMPDCKQYKDESHFIELPCKVGDTVYLLREDTECIEGGYVQQFIKYTNSVGANIRLETGRNSIIDICEFGKTVFLTREEAEQALKEASKDV